MAHVHQKCGIESKKLRSTKYVYAPIVTNLASEIVGAYLTTTMAGSSTYRR